MSESVQDLPNPLRLQCDLWHMVAITILYWDHVLTFKTEYKCLWKRPSTSGYLFFLNRYFNALAVLLSMISLFDADLHLSCRRLSQFREALLITTQLIVVAILTLRIYALYGCSKRLLYFMLSFTAVLLGVAIFCTCYYPGKVEYETPSGRCITQYDFKAASRKAIAWQMLLIYDTLLFGLALHNAFKTRQELRTLRNLKYKTSLKVILLRDGALYFCAMALVNLVNILTCYTLEGCMRGGLAPVTSSLSVTMVSRMMLNLHVVVDTGIYLSQYTSQLDEQQDTRIVFYERRPTRDSFDI
uniref:DUF6533 domain-containing protein n=1 Tax=Moniliophthora roreri TaxID=221103 RepID=A0A0W0EXR7_MONRR